MFYKGGIRPITEEDVESFNHPAAITERVFAYKVGGEIIIQTGCPRIASVRQMFQRLPSFILPADSEPWLTIEPTEAMGETA